MDTETLCHLSHKLQKFKLQNYRVSNNQAWHFHKQMLEVMYVTYDESVPLHYG